MRRITAVAASLASAAAVAAVGLGTAAPANAATTTGCTPVSGGQPYLSGWGDTNTYVLATGGSFSSTTSPWALNRAYVNPSVNAPLNLTGSTNPGALVVSSGGTATSPASCITWADDRIRFFYRAPALTSFKVSIITTSSIGTSTYNTWLTPASNDWQISPAIMIPDWTDASGTQKVQVRISNPAGLPVTVDDVLIDPWRNTRW